MLFDLESVKLQEGFKQVASIKLVEQIQSGARFLTDEGVLEVSFYADQIVRLRFLKASETDYGILAEKPQQINAKVYSVDGGFLVRSGEVSLEIKTNPMRIRFLREQRTLLESVTDRTIQGELRFSPFACRNNQEWLVSLALSSNESIYGLGEKFGALNRRGQLITNWNRDATGVNAEISYKNTPFAWSTDGWGLYCHSVASVTHGVGYAPWSHRSYVIKIGDPNLDLFLIAGKEPAEIIEKFTWLTGRAPLPPLWSFGMWMSRAFYKSAEELLEVAHNLRERRIPCDVITLDGRAWHPSETRFDFSWDPDRYPDPAGFVKSLLDINFRLCLWEYPYLSTKNPLFDELDSKGFFLKTSSGDTYIHRWFPPPMDTIVPHLQPSGIIDFTNPEAYAWFRDAHKALFDIGVAVMKPDYGEAVPEEVIAYNGDNGKRVHNVYALLYNRCAYEASQRYGEGSGMVWSRAGWTGSQRYPIQWGGDPQGDWEGLAGSIRGGLSWGMSGGPFYSHDIGGFYGQQSEGGILGSGMPDAELYVRWAQAGILSSHTRFHGTSPREPWEFGEEVETIIRKWLRFRYQIIPYLLECAKEANQTGTPVMRAMPLAFPSDPCAWKFETQYMLGPALLVAPIIQPGGDAQVYLPEGEWYDIWNGERLLGPKLINYTLLLDRFPVFGKRDTSILLGPPAQHTGELGQNSKITKITFSGSSIAPIFTV
jgi:alpha-D-xyloside xylohydrolase